MGKFNFSKTDLKVNFAPDMVTSIKSGQNYITPMTEEYHKYITKVHDDSVKAGKMIQTHTDDPIAGLMYEGRGLKKFVKEGSYRFFRSVGRAAKETFLGSKKMHVPPGAMFETRLKGRDVYFKTRNEVKPIRARIKSPESIEGKLNKGDSEINDVLGMQIYSRSPEKTVDKIVEIFKKGGSKKVTVKPKDKEGYIGANISGDFYEVPTEIQLSPGYRVNFGQNLQHDVYKRPEGFTDWDVKQADKWGKRFVKWGIANKPEWLKFLGRE